MAKQLNVNLAFTADTKQVEQQLNNLRNQLTKLINTAPSSGFSGFTKELQTATTAAATLKTHLDNAINVDTGKLDLGKFQQGLKQSGKDLTYYKEQLTSLGPQGAAAFSQLSQAIMNAEMPLRRTSALLSQFATTLKNTARWQLSSSMLHGFMGAVQSAYYYAQDLNESLNNIRIVTGKNTEEMAAFAKEANEAAKALSTSTTAYTDASLIYYQQGLSDEEVKQRTDVTVKMANVSRQSAEDVSEQMTAIWNNFAKGGENLEYYTDVITALGAATASSSAEIAEGLEKFAAVADTVGLSYEYATAALATVTATTRQSADIVGNAFKTLFARLEGLSLGDTLDDGTDLTKYSQALDKVGISIKTTTGDMKDMDQILDELGQKWQTLGKDQQIALAQTVAGVRQYTQLIALMDNWDFFQQNLGVAQGSAGTLQEQANIYAESWEAASKRVKASAEAIYDSLLDDKFFIKLNDTLSKTLDILNDLIKAVGGAKGVLLIAGNLILKAFGTNLAEGINNAIYRLQMLTKDGRESIQETKNEINTLLKEFYQQDGNKYNKIIGHAYEQQGAAQDAFIKQAEKLDDVQRKIAATLLDQHNVLVQNVIEQAKLTQAAENQANSSLRQAKNIGLAGLNQGQKVKAKELLDNLSQRATQESNFTAINRNLFGDVSSSNFRESSKNLEILKNNITGVIAQLGKLGASTEENEKLLSKMLPPEIVPSFVKLYEILSKLDPEMDLIAGDAEEIETALDDLIDEQTIINQGSTEMDELVEKLTQDYAIQDKVVEGVIQKSNQYGESLGDNTSKTISLDNATNNFSNNLTNLIQRMNTAGEVISAYAQATAKAAMMATTLTTSLSLLSDTETSTSQKLLSLTTSLGMLGSGFATAIKNIATAEGSFKNLTIASNVYLIALTTFITVLVSVKRHFEELEQAAKEAAKWELEVAESGLQELKEKADAIDNVVDSYKELTEQAKINEKSLENLRYKTYLLCQEYGNQQDALKALYGTYEEILEIQNKVAIGTNEQTISQAKDVQYKALESAELVTKKLDINSNRFSTNEIELFNKLNQFGIFSESSSMTGHYEINNSAFIKNWDQIQQILNSTNSTFGNTVYSNINKLFNNTELKELANKFQQANEDIKSAQLDNIVKSTYINGKVNSYEDYLKVIEQIRKQAKDLITDEKELNQWLNTTLGSIEEFQEYNTKAGIEQALEQQLKSVSQDIKQYIATIPDEDKELLLQVHLDKYSSKEYIISQLDYLKQQLAYDVEPIELTAQIAENVLDGKDYIESLEELRKNEKYKELLINFENKSLTDQLEILGQIRREQIKINDAAYNNSEVSQKAKKGNEQELQRLQEESIRLHRAIEDGRRRYANENDIQELERELFEINNLIQDLTGQQFTINLDLESNYLDSMSTVVDDIIDKASILKSAAELIGEGFIVAKEDAEKLLSIYPELYEQSIVLANGNIQLEKEIVQAVLNGNKDIISNDSLTTQKRLEDKITLLDAEIKFSETKIELLKQALNNDIDYSEASEKIASAEAEYEKTLTEKLGQINEQAIQNEIDNSEKSTQIGLENLDKLGERASAVSKVYAKMLSGEAVEYSPNGDTAVGGSASSFTSSVDLSGLSIDNSTYQQQLLQALDEAQFSLDTQLALRSSYTELLSKLRGGTQDALDALNGAASGKGGKTSKKDIKELNEQLDRYWDINNAISATNTQLEIEEAEMKKLNSMQSKVFGKELISNLQAQNKQLEKRNKILDDQKKNYEQLFKIQQGELAEVKTALASFGGAFEGDALTNYAPLLTDALNKYKAAIQAYNVSAQSESDKAQLEAVEKYYNKLKDLTERYQDLYYSEIADTQNKLNDLAQQQMENQLKILENNLKSWEITIDLKLDMTQMERDWNNFIKQVEEDFRKIYKDLTIDSAFGRENFDTYAKDVQTTVQAIRDVEAEINKMQGGGSSDMFASITEAQEKLKALQSQMLEQGNNINSIYQEIWSNYISGLDQVADKLNDINDQYKKIDDELNYQKSLVELLYGDKAYDMMDKFYDAQTKNILGQIDSMKSQVDFWENEFQKSYQMNKDRHNVNLDDMSTWTEDMKKAYDQLQTSQSNLNNLIAEGVKNLQEDYLNAINKIIDTMNKNVWGTSFDEMKEDWDHIQNLAKEYLDDIEGAYQIQSLANKIDQGIASASTLANQQKLQKLRDNEIDTLREKENLTQHDIDLAEARYQIALKEMALQDAQNSKTSMKLTRDSSGNWTYQYVADDSDVLSKQQDLLDAYNNLYKMADDAYTHAMELAMNTYAEMQEKVKEIADDMTLAEEEKMARIQEIYDTYLPEITAAVTNAELYRQEAMMASAATFAEVCEQDAAAYETLTDKQKEIVDSVRDHHLEDYEEIRSAIVDEIYPDIAAAAKEAFEETNLNSQTAAAAIIHDWAKDSGTSVRAQMNQAIDDMQKHIQNYEHELDVLQVTGDIDFGKLGEKIDETGNKVDELQNKTADMCISSSGYLDTLRENVDSIEQAWEGVIEQIRDAKIALLEYLAVAGQEVNNPSGSEGEGAGFTDTIFTNGLTRGNGNNSNEPSKESKDKGREYTAYVYGTDPMFEDEIDHRTIEKIITGTAEEIANEYKKFLQNKNPNEYTLEDEWGHHYVLPSYASGGYTGAWNETGGLAVLHQKELVLNADDTVNMLEAVSTIRELANINDSIGASIASSIGAMAINLATKGANNFDVGSSNTDNQFYITAEFPNANDVETIREAILSLPNYASQYIH